MENSMTCAIAAMALDDEKRTP